MNFEDYVEDCKDKNSYLYPLRMRYNVLKLSDSITFGQNLDLLGDILTKRD